MGLHLNGRLPPVDYPHIYLRRRIRKEITSLSKIEKPEISANEKILENQLNDLKQQALKKKDELDGSSPFVEILKSAVVESEDKHDIDFSKE